MGSSSILDSPAADAGIIDSDWWVAIFLDVCVYLVQEALELGLHKGFDLAVILVSVRDLVDV